MISVGTYQACFKVEAKEDVFIELDEVFSIFVDTINTHDVVNTNITLVITDNDGEVFFYHHNYAVIYSGHVF